MLEIIILISVGSSIRKILKPKGIKPLKYILIMIGLWFGLEILGGVIGFLIFGEESLAYLLTAYVGAGLGAYLSYRIAQNAASEASPYQEDILDAGM